MTKRSKYATLALAVLALVGCKGDPRTLTHDEIRALTDACMSIGGIAVPHGNWGKITSVTCVVKS